MAGQSDFDKIKVAIAGINGKMGRASAALVFDDPELELVAALGRPGAAYIGTDVGVLIGRPATGVKVTAVGDGLPSLKGLPAAQRPDVILEFTLGEQAFKNATAALELGICPVIGTSGLGEPASKALTELAAKLSTGAMIVPNFSVGAVLMMEFSRQAAAHFECVEIVEMHGVNKIDAPSGTATHTANKLAAAGKGPFNPARVQEHESMTGARGGKGPNGVRVHSLRLPGLISHQDVLFGSDGELLVIKHESFNTNCFSKGIKLAIKAVTKQNGMVIGLESLLGIKIEPPTPVGAKSK